MKRFTTLVLGVCLSAALAYSDDNRNGIGEVERGVPNANARVGHPDNIVAPRFALKKVIDGSAPIENPSGTITNFGLLNDKPPRPVEATRTEPDENTYLVFDKDPGGPTPGFDYGRHFLYQGHENGGGNAYITRVNLDVTDPAHRVTLLTPQVNGQTGFSSIDGSTWNPFTKTLLFTSEAGSPTGGVIQVTPGWPPVVTKLDGIVGSSAYEGIHADNTGNIFMQEDAGGVTINAGRQPNSFVYRFVPNDVTDLSKGGKLQALQVTVDGAPLIFHANDAAGDILSTQLLHLNTPGTSWPAKWVTVHDTGVNGTTAFNANALAKAAGATPFKRPENMAWLPGSSFRTFFFDPTGDTNADAGNQPALAARGAWGAIFRVDLDRANDTATVSIAVLGDAAHSSFDNLAFINNRQLLAAEDRGDNLHRQLNTLDSIWTFHVRGDDDDDDDRGNDNAPRFLALGRDPASETDAAFLDAGTPGFQNDGDNEPTGVFVSNGDPSIRGLLGTRESLSGARGFFTQQHGQNTVWEIVRTEDDGRDRN